VAPPSVRSIYKRGNRSKSTDQERPLALLVALFAVLYLTLTIVLVRTNPDLITYIGSLMNPVLAITAAIVAFVLTRQMGAGNPNRALWTGLSIGWACWAIAEALYAIPVFSGKEAAYPSAADIFWLLGYLPMLYAFLQRQRELPVKLSRKNRIISWVATGVVVIFNLIFILVPILSAFDPANLVESILNLLYPIANLFLLLFVIRIFFAFTEGGYGQARLWVAIGFFAMTVSDLVYCYLVGIDHYYPNGEAAFMSVFVVDYTYTISYLLFLVGLIVLQRIATFSSPFIKARNQ
jgi:hypothetical protein